MPPWCLPIGAEVVLQGGKETHAGLIVAPGFVDHLDGHAPGKLQLQDFGALLQRGRLQLVEPTRGDRAQGQRSGRLKGGRQGVAEGDVQGGLAQLQAVFRLQDLALNIGHMHLDAEQVRLHHHAAVKKVLDPLPVGFRGSQGVAGGGQAFFAQLDGEVALHHIEEDLLADLGLLAFLDLLVHTRHPVAGLGLAALPDGLVHRDLALEVGQRIGVVEPVEGEVRGGERALVQERTEGVHRIVAVGESFAEIHPGIVHRLGLAGLGPSGLAVLRRRLQSGVVLDGQPGGFLQRQPGGVRLRGEARGRQTEENDHTGKANEIAHDTLLTRQSPDFDACLDNGLNGAHSIIPPTGIPEAFVRTG